jgi:23S rRNA (uracil1939-C5)-methyltransferase
MSAPTISATTAAITPRCPHFGACGGCQYQDLACAEQLRVKRAQLEDLLREANVSAPDLDVHTAEPWSYRNRIRLRLTRVDGTLRFGYNKANTTEFLPIVTCPISAPILIEAVEALVATAPLDRDAEFWLNAATEAELFCDHDLARLQMTLHCAPRTKPLPDSFAHMFAAVQAAMPQLVGAAAIASDPRTGPTGRTLGAAGATGLAYRVGDESYWITRGAFFQVNRFLIEALADLVCNTDGKPRRGALAWDLYAGVGLFSRILAHSFARVTAVEANPTAAQDLRAALTKLSPASTTVEATTLDFLRRAVLDRDRPELVVLDPPRAGAGLEACNLLSRIQPRTIVYVSCDPATLTRDLQALQSLYKISALHLVDLFPQTSHLETIAILNKIS